MNDYSWVLDKDYLEHHGILGQKWGVRRYQNEDGTLTNAGRKRLDKLGKRYTSRSKFLKVNKQKTIDEASKLIGTNKELMPKYTDYQKALQTPTRTKDDVRKIDWARNHMLDSVDSISEDKKTRDLINKVLYDNGDDLMLKDAGRRLNESSKTGNDALDQYMDFVFDPREETTSTKDHKTNMTKLKQLEDRAETNKERADQWKKIDPKLKRSFNDVDKDIRNKSMDAYFGEYKTKRAKQAGKEYEKERKAGNYTKASEILAKAALKDIGVKPTKENINWIIDNNILEQD